MSNEIEGPSGFTVGKYYFFRTPTWYWSGRLLSVDWGGYWIDNVCEVQDTGPIVTAWGPLKKMARSEAYPAETKCYITGPGTVVLEWSPLA